MQESKTVQRIVWTFGFTVEQTQIIRRYLPSGAVELCEVECVTDIMVSDPMAVLVYVSNVEQTDLEQLLAYYEEVRDFSETVVFVGNCPGKRVSNRITFYDNFDSLQDGLKYTLLAALKRKKNAESFSRSVSYALHILKAITENPGISSKELSQKLELSQRSVTRYIETLNMAGESIVYDRKSNGWSLEYPEPLLKL